MRSWLLPLVALLACAGPQKTAPAGAPAAPRTLVPKGFERVPGEILHESSLAHDGTPDVWKYTLKDASGKEVLLRKEKDLNGDGKVDTWEKYAPDGSLVSVAYDLDFDGTPDEILYYDGDRLVKKELSFGFDGVPRTSSYYEKGKLVRKERDRNGDGRVDYWEYWENGEIDRIGVDEDGDGQVDRWEARRTAGAAPEGVKAPTATDQALPAPSKPR